MEDLKNNEIRDYIDNTKTHEELTIEWLVEDGGRCFEGVLDG